MDTRDCGTARCSEAVSLERLRYFPRQLLTADDMRAEQEYFRDKQRRHNRLLHGWGVVCGLEVRQTGPLEVMVCPGYALGPCGDEICVCEPVKLDLASCARPPADPCNPPGFVPQTPPPSKLFVVIRYVECPTRPMRTLPAGCGCDETACEYSRTRDGFEVQCIPKPTDDTPVTDTICDIERHRKQQRDDLHPKCQPRPRDEWLLLARITPASTTTGGVKIDQTIDNTVRRIVYSSAAIQAQLIQLCPQVI